MDVDVCKRVMGPLVAHRLACPQFSDDVDLLAKELGALDTSEPDSLELMVECPDPEARDHPPGARDVFQRAQCQGCVDRVTVRNERGSPQGEALGAARQQRQSDERVDMRPVLSLHAMRVKDEVVTNPDRVEAEALGQGCAPKEICGSLFAEMGEKQPIREAVSTQCSRLLTQLARQPTARRLDTAAAHVQRSKPSIAECTHAISATKIPYLGSSNQRSGFDLS